MNSKINMKFLKNKLNEFKENIMENYLFEFIFIFANLLNSFMLRLITVKNIFSISPFMMELFFLLFIVFLSYGFKTREKRNKFYIIVSFILFLTCFINSIYYHYYHSFASISMLANLIFAKDVGDAIVENVIKIEDFFYFIPFLFIILSYKYLSKNKYFKKENSIGLKSVFKNNYKYLLIVFIIGGIFMPQNAWVRIYKLWNRESVVMNFGIYIYQTDDFIQSLVPKINGLVGKDKAYKKVTTFYENNKKKHEKNEYSNIFAGKNVIVIHYESLQTFAMNLKFNNKEVTPVLNKMANDGFFFSNFYSQVGVGTSSDAEFTFNTSLMPSNKGTVFVNFFNREFIATPALLKNKGYYTFSMHGNTGEFWNRNTMHKNLGYDNFYSKDSYEIDEVIGLGLSDKSFYRQSVAKIKDIKESGKIPFYGLLITLTNHTPFNDMELIDEFKTTMDVEINNQTVTRNYLNETLMGNYLRSVHYSDQALGEFISLMDKENLLDNTIFVIYGDHDARLNYKYYNLMHNYDPINDTILTKDDEGYVEYNKYDYKLEQNVPFVIWSKDKNFNVKVDTPMGMIDVLPTLGNMLGIESEYQLGTDIFNIKDNDNVVTFIDGSFLTSKIYYDAPKGKIYSINNDAIDEKYVKDRVKYSSELIEISNDIISYDLIRKINTDKLNRK